MTSSVMWLLIVIVIIAWFVKDAKMNIYKGALEEMADWQLSKPNTLSTTHHINSIYELFDNFSLKISSFL